MKNNLLISTAALSFISSAAFANDFHVQDPRFTGNNVSISTTKSMESNARDARMAIDGQISLGAAAITLGYADNPTADSDLSIGGKFSGKNFNAYGSYNIQPLDEQGLTLDRSTLTLGGNFVMDTGFGSSNIGLAYKSFNTSSNEPLLETDNSGLSLNAGSLFLFGDMYYRGDIILDMVFEDSTGLNIENKLGWTNQALDIHLSADYGDYGYQYLGSVGTDFGDKEIFFGLHLGYNF
ncbi:hypothetical protein [Aliivibrio sp. EL58]|uniref:hypothetical protein n=1 Tax=Aliivibrio sp. EL58 TaxID=2107582 RepID=UPI000EFA97AB|nr:hypothetical protein [Aliivibrio sp. EL58]